ncbi:MAG: metalloregulator ArsR/SmtB family transcription factor [Gemmatimonadota bacterium]|nr:metalloregulator ArsR/SmtB family transcription factor [Gemmatimonadota bacterium]
MPRTPMSPELLDLVAARFRAFGEPARLRILEALRGGEQSVGELVADTGLGQANLSRHLQQMLALGLVRRRKAGRYAYYVLTDPDVLRLCDVVCGRLDRENQAQRAVLRSAG